MIESKHLATVPAASLPTPSEWGTITTMAKELVSTGFLPDTIKTPAQAAAVILKGRELNIPPMYALSNIVVIKGKPTCGAELMLALIYRDHGDNAIQFPETTNERCTIAYQRRSWAKPQTYTFTIQDAGKAGLTSDTWKKYPAAMLRARCISAVARLAFADTIGGMYLPEELGATVTVVDDEVVVDSSSYVVSRPDVIDAEAGEIVDATPPHARFDAQELRSGIVEQSKANEASRNDTPERRKNGLAAVFAAGQDRGLKQGEIKALCYWKFKVESMTELTADQLGVAWKWINETPPRDLKDQAEDLVEAAMEAEMMAMSAASMDPVNA